MLNEISSRTNESIEEMIRKYSNMVYRLALSQTKNKADADDVFQEVFMRLAAHTKPFVNEEHRKAWLIRVTINCSRKLFRSAWFRRTVPLSDEVSECHTVEVSDVFDAVMALPRKYRTVIHLFYYEDLSILQISQLLSINESTVKSQLFRTRKLLRLKLGGDFDE